MGYFIGAKSVRFSAYAQNDKLSESLKMCLEQPEVQSDNHSVAISVVACFPVALQLFTQDGCPSRLVDIMSANGTFYNVKGFSLLSRACACRHRGRCNATLHARCAPFPYMTELGIQFFVGELLDTPYNLVANLQSGNSTIVGVLLRWRIILNTLVTHP